ncbi:hypothetical protein [Edaphobacter modestus]|uniref:hypothetical protein n=1 Tax=Edaphobacter modestus TaxID=388466 RepID=UPI001A90F3B3|nr:hypothetical protein [Edaphobacter modestus]
MRGEDGHVSTIKVAERDDRPDEDGWSQENSFEIDAFSRDGKKVLLSPIEAQGDWDETTPIVLDLTNDMQWRIELYPLFKKQIPADCSVVYRALEFTSKGNVLISAASTETDLEVGTKPCFANSLWELDYRNKKTSRVTSIRSQTR